jgi:hypothetical protein
VACNVGRAPVRCLAAAGLTAVLSTAEDPAGDVVPPDATVWFAPAGS